MPAESTIPERRIALVVGNSHYRDVSPLKNPRNDARLIAKSLKSVGFELVDGGPQLDLDKTSFDRVIQDFGNALQGATAALFYYAGHGLQINDSNYLIPTSANPTRVSDVDFQMVNIDTILHQMEGGGARLNVVILDACRNNPFGGSGLRALGGGLGQAQVPDGTYIQYAAQPHAVAIDGEGDDSPYSASLAKIIREPGIDIYHALNRVGLDVKQQTGGKQEPWLAVSPIEGADFYFVKPAPTPVIATVSPPPSPAPALAGFPNEDLAFWLSIPANNTNPDFMKLYLKNFPNGRFAGLARLRLQALQGSSNQPPQPVTSATAVVSSPSSRIPATQTFTAITRTAIDREQARVLARRMHQSGYAPRLLASHEAGRLAYHIQVGPFVTKAEADAAQTILDGLEPRVAMASPTSPHPPSVQPSPALPQPEARPTYAAQSDQLTDYNKAIILRMGAAQLGFDDVHVVSKTINGQQGFAVEVSSLPNARKAAQVRRKLDELAMQLKPGESAQQENSTPPPPLALTADTDTNQISRAQENRGLYRIQIGDSFDQSRAQELMQRLWGLGYAPQLIASREAGQTSYRIEIGGFPSEDAAEEVEDELQQRNAAALNAEHPRPPNVSSSRSVQDIASPEVRRPLKVSPTPVSIERPQIAKADKANKDLGIVFSAAPDPLGKVNPKAFASASYYDRGDDYFAANNLDAAIEQFRKAIDLDPTNVDAYYALGLTLYAKRDLAGSIANFRKATSLKPDYPDAYYNWGLALDDLGEFGAAVPKFKKAVELRPGYADAYYDWGRALSRTGDLEGAMDKFQRATDLKPGYADAYYAWGVALYEKQRFDESIAKYRRALELRPTNPTYKEALASAITAQQQSERR
jgi:tetratricopeptide (TPR) repeat protein